MSLITPRTARHRARRALVQPASLALTTALIAGCGPLPEDPFELAAPAVTSSPIIDGEPCNERVHPASVVILIDAEKQVGGELVPLRKPICTGALVTPDTVLTASHCLDPLALEDGSGPIVSLRYMISFSSDVAPLASGDTDQFPADAVDIAARELHPDYDLGAFSGINGLGNFHDIGLAFLSRSVTDVAPVLIVTADEGAQVQSGADVEMVGWGWQEPDPPPPAGTVGVKICASSFINEVGAHEMQIGDDDSLPRKCHGDSGGPTFMLVDTTASRRVRVVGVTSHTYDASECQKGSVDTRVDAWLDWIDATMRARCADGTRVWCDTEGIILPSGGGQEPEPEPGCRCASARGASPIVAALALLFFPWRRARARRG